MDGIEVTAACEGPTHCCISVGPDPVSIRLALRKVRDRFGPSCGADLTGRLELVMAELLNNIVEHGYALTPPPPSDEEPRRGRGKVRLSVAEACGGLYCIVADRGGAVPPACLAPRQLPNDDIATATLAEGGYGWFIIQMIARNLSYQSEQGCNVLAFLIPDDDTSAAA